MRKAYNKTDMEEKRYLKNPFTDFLDTNRTPVKIDEEAVKKMISMYVDTIVENCRHAGPEKDTRGDLYVGNAGIAYMFWKMSRCKKTKDLYPTLQNAHEFIQRAKTHGDRYKKRHAERYSFLCGNAGIYAVSAVIAHDLKLDDEFAKDLITFKTGIAPSQEFMHTKYGCDEVLVGRAGYLAGCYWLNDMVGVQQVSDDDLISICKMICKSGREYAKKHNLHIPLMYQYHGTLYLGAAHGLCAILQMVLNSPWFRNDKITAPPDELRDLKGTLDCFLRLQDTDGNFPVAFDDVKNGRVKRLVHWCHGAPGAAYLLGRAYLVFQEDRYLQALRNVAELTWKRGLLLKGPGLCHGIAGNGYVFLLLYRLTHEPKYLYRATKYMEMLTDTEFRFRARTPDRPYSLYEGLAGTVCFLVDLLEPENAQFPFMDIFH